MFVPERSYTDVTPKTINAPRRTRTYNPLIKSQLLFAIKRDGKSCDDIGLRRVTSSSDPLPLSRFYADFQGFATASLPPQRAWHYGVPIRQTAEGSSTDSPVLRATTLYSNLMLVGVMNPCPCGVETELPENICQQRLTPIISWKCRKSVILHGICGILLNRWKR
jgi:hypothetical protein